MFIRPVHTRDKMHFKTTKSSRLEIYFGKKDPIDFHPAET